MNECMDTICDQLLEDISLKVMLELDDGSNQKSYFPLTEEQLVAYENSTNQFHSSSFFVSPTSEFLAGDANPGSASGAMNAEVGGSTPPSPPSRQRTSKVER